MTIWQRFAHWDLVLWFAWIGGGLALESLGLWRQRDATLTVILRSAVPRWLAAMVVGWLFYHFVIQTAGK